MFEVLRNKGAIYQEADDVMAKVAQMNIMNDKEIDNYEDEDDEDELDLSIDDLLDGIDEEDIERGSSEFEADIADYMNSRLVAMDIKEDSEMDEVDELLTSLEEDVLDEGIKEKVGEFKDKVKATNAARGEKRDKICKAIDKVMDHEEEEERLRRELKADSDRRYRQADAEYKDARKAAKDEYKAKRREIWRGKKEELDIIDAYLDEGCKDCNDADGSADKESEQGESGALKRELRATKQDQPKVPHDAEDFWTIEPAKKDEGRSCGNKSAYAEEDEINFDEYDFSIDEDVMDESCLDKAKGIARRAKDKSIGAMEVVKAKLTKKEELDMMDDFLDEGCKDCNDADGSADKESEQGESGALKRELRATLSDQPKVPHDAEDFWTIDPSKKDEGRSCVVKQVHEDEEFNLDEYDFSIDEEIEEGCCGKKEADKMGNATKGDKPLNEEEVDESVDFEKISEPARGLARKVIGVAGNVNDAVSDKARKPVEEDVDEINFDDYDFSIDEDTLEEERLSVQASSKRIADNVAAGTAIVPPGDVKDLTNDVERGPQRHEDEDIDIDDYDFSVDEDSLEESYDLLTEDELNEMLYESEELLESELFQNDGDNVNTWRDVDKIDNSKDLMFDDDDDDLDDELLDI